MMTATATRKIIYSNFEPFAPNGWIKTEHKDHGDIEWNPALIDIHRFPGQEGGKSMPGPVVRREVSIREKAEPTEKNPKLIFCNASVLDFLIPPQPKHLSLEKPAVKIPSVFFPDYEGDVDFQCNVFWNTIFQNVHEREFVLCLLCFRDGTVRRSFLPADHCFSAAHPAVVFK